MQFFKKENGIDSLSFSFPVKIGRMVDEAEG